MAEATVIGLKRVARRTSFVGGRLTYKARMLPAFLIVGAQRCGTTSMFRALTGHPAVLPPFLRKGVHYFDTGYDPALSWYRAHFPLRLTAAAVRARTGTDPITGESSPYYMFHPLAAERIARDLPEVKLIVLVRDPVERAYSAHAHELARGYETEPFERALELEPERLRGEEERLRADPAAYSHHHQHHAYVGRGEYAPQLERLRDRVGGRLYVADSGRLFAEPDRVYREVLDFLGLPGDPGAPRFARHNARPRSPMPESVRARLEEHFRPYDEKLKTWLGGTPSWRR